MATERDIFVECSRLIEKGLRKEAVDLLTEAIAAAPNREHYYLRGTQYEHLGEFDKALDDFTSALQLEPNDANYLVSRGVLLSSRLGCAQDSLADFCRASTVDPHSPVPHQQLSLCHLQLGNLDAACDHADRAIALDDSDGYSHYCLGQCRLAAERFHSAAKEFETAIALNPQTARFWIGLSKAYEGTGDLEKAEMCCQNAIDLEASATSFIQLAKIQLDKANPQRAIESLEYARQFELGEVELTLVNGYSELAKRYS